MPWFAIVAIVAIVVWGVLMVIGMVTGRQLPGTGPEANELEDLRKRLEALESGHVQAEPKLERRIDRLEARMEKRELRAEAHEDWESRAKDLGLDGGPDGGGPGR